MQRFTLCATLIVMASEERSLIETFCRERDERSFRALYDLHSPPLYSFLRRSINDAAVCDDVFQETWLRAMTRIDWFRFESSFRSWLIGIAINCWRESRRAGERASFEYEDVAVAPHQPAIHLDLQSAIERLPSGYRTVLLLHDVEGYNHGEIARMLSVDEGTSRSQLHHARRAVRAFLSSTSGARV